VALESGTRIGPYEVDTLLGSGGMGEVYRARDMRLGRDVAIKVVPPAFTADPDRLTRFEREARLLATLNHPHICTVYGVEESQGGRALILELIEGVTLADRIGSGPIPIRQALAIAEQIADALEAAHEKGVVHRDLKPANVKLTPDGVAKVLDFGLAKSSMGSLAGVTQATETAGGTRDGIILGTAAYMSPEQARGQPVDKRTDVWAFGCLLYEMLAGRSPFSRQTVSDTIAAILEREPDWSALADGTPTEVARLLRRCLEKESRQRLRDIGDARLELHDLSTAPTPLPSPGRDAARVRMTRWIGVATVGVVAASLGYYLATGKEPAKADVHPTRFAVELPLAAPQLSRGLGNHVMALSPDGSHLAFFARQSGELAHLWVRSLDQLESKLIASAEGGFDPFFSPDGRWIGFFEGHQIKRVAITGGDPLTICDTASAGDAAGASWATEDTIFFTPSPTSGLWRVAAAGGVPSPVLTDKDIEYRWPQVLPDKKLVVFTSSASGSPAGSERQIFVQSLDSKERRALIQGTGGYVAGGYLIFLRGNTVLAVPVDLDRLQTAGTPQPLIDRVSTAAPGASMSLSRTGSLAYVPASSQPDGTLAWVSRDGTEQRLSAPVRPYSQPRLSPDLRQLAVTVEPTIGSVDSVWMYDFSREMLSPLAADRSSSFPVWTPDGRGVTFFTSQGIYSRAIDGSGREEQLLTERPGPTMSWSSDGRTLVFVRIEQANLTDLWLLSFDDLGKPQQPRPFVQSRSREGGAVFAPDGRSIAYVSNETGRNEIWVRSVADAGLRQQISTEGGNEVTWPRPGRELFFRAGDLMMVVDVRTTPTFTAGKPRPLFKGKYTPSTALWSNYDVTPDGRRFLMVKPTTASQLRPQSINVLLNWPEALRRATGQER